MGDWNMTKRSEYAMKLLFVFSLMFAMLPLTGAKGGCGGGLDNRKGEPGINVGGVLGALWSVNYSDTVTVRIKDAAGAIVTKKYALGTGGPLRIGDTDVDLSQLCARDDVACPHEIFPGVVRMTQPGNDQHLLYVAFNKVGPFKELKQGTLLGNVDSDNDFSIALGIGAAANGTCGLLGVSYATGHIDASLADPDKGVKMKGDIIAAYAGGCAIAGKQGAAAAGVTFELIVSFEATRQSP